MNSKMIARCAFLSILVLFLGGNIHGTADNSQCDLEGNLSERVFVAYGPDATRENAVLFQEHFSDAEGRETGHCQYATKPQDEMYGELEYSEINYYDVSRRLSRRHAIVYREDEPTVCDYTYTYNEDGKLMTMSTKCDEDPNLVKRTYEYDSEGKLLNESYFRNDDLLTYTIIDYDDEGHKTKETDYMFTGEELESSTFTYDIKGQLVSETQIEHVQPPKVTECFYNYDVLGRLMKKEEVRDFGPMEIRKTILYYEYPLFVVPTYTN